MKIDWEKIGRSGKTLHATRKAALEYICAHGKGSPVQVSAECGEALGNVSYHMKAMREYKEPWLLPAGTRPRRGALEHFYKLGPGAPVIDDATEAEAA